MRFAIDFRNTFKTDIVIDVIGYRKYGHNELDQPAFTQPSMYNKISQMKPTYETYVQKLIDENVLDTKTARARE